jgi:AcrR family transcriptional regulator
LSPSRRRAVILDAAREVFARHGYQGASMRQIAAASGVTTPILYDHFVSKQALYVHLLESETNALIEATAGIAVPDNSREALLTAGAEAFFAFVEQHPSAWRMLFRDVPGDPQIAEKHRAMQRRGDRAIAELLTAIPGSRSRPTAHPDGVAFDMLAVAVRSVVNGLASWWWDHRDTPRADVVAAAVDLLAHGVLAQ